MKTIKSKQIFQFSQLAVRAGPGHSLIDFLLSFAFAFARLWIGFIRFLFISKMTLLNGRWLVVFLSPLSLSISLFFEVCLSSSPKTQMSYYFITKESFNCDDPKVAVVMENNKISVIVLLCSTKHNFFKTKATAEAPHECNQLYSNWPVMLECISMYETIDYRECNDNPCVSLIKCWKSVPQICIIVCTHFSHKRDY